MDFPRLVSDLSLSLSLSLKEQPSECDLDNPRILWVKTFANHIGLPLEMTNGSWDWRQEIHSNLHHPTLANIEDAKMPWFNIKSCQLQRDKSLEASPVALSYFCSITNLTTSIHEKAEPTLPIGELRFARSADPHISPLDANSSALTWIPGELKESRNSNWIDSAAISPAKRKLLLKSSRKYQV